MCQNGVGGLREERRGHFSDNSLKESNSLALLDKAGKWALLRGPRTETPLVEPTGRRRAPREKCQNAGGGRGGDGVLNNKTQRDHLTIKTTTNSRQDWGGERLDFLGRVLCGTEENRTPAHRPTQPGEQPLGFEAQPRPASVRSHQGQHQAVGSRLCWPAAGGCLGLSHTHHHSGTHSSPGTVSASSSIRQSLMK